MKYLLLVITLFLFFASSANQVFSATIKINEFSSAAGTSSDPDYPDWVEVYFEGMNTALYRLVDEAGNAKDLPVCSGNFCTVDWSNRLNNSGDVIKLVLILFPDSPVDQVAYGSSGSDVVAPTAGQYVGRSSDGTGNWVIFSASTKGSTNNTATPAPTATPSPTVLPTNTPTPTTAPTATKTPTLTPIKTPTPTPTPIKSGLSGGSGATATPKPTASPISAPTKILTLSSQAAGGSGNIKNSTSPIATSSPTPIKSGPTKKPTPTPIKSGQTAILGVAQNNLSKILIGAGLIFLLACGILAFWSFRKAKNDESHY